MASKNQSRQGRDFMGHHEDIGCLPKYNYGNGFGWKKHKKHHRANAFGQYSIIRKQAGYQNKVRLG